MIRQDTISKYNVGMAQYTLDLLEKAQKVGINDEDMLISTGYQAQYDIYRCSRCDQIHQEYARG